jgi:replicative DNA helicase
MVEKQLPFSLEAEMGVLGSLIIDEDAMALIADKLTVADFYRNVHKDIYEAMLYLFEHRTPTDYLALCNELKRRDRPCEDGWEIYLDRLTDEVPTSSHAEFYAEIVREKAEKRQLIHAAGRIAAIAYEEEPNALEQAEQIIYAIGARRGLGDFEAMSAIASSYINDLDALHEHRGQVVGVPTGLPLDSIIGGMQQSDLVILAARPSQGKTSLALTIAHNAAIKYRKRVGIFSLEMSKKQLAQRMVSMTSRVDLQKLRTAWIEEKDWGRIVAAVDILSEGALWIADTTGLSVASMRSKCRRLQAQHGLDLLIVDYLQLMQSADPKQHANRVQEISDISRGLKLLAMELDIPVLALSQLSRKVEERAVKIPQLSDLRDSGSLEQDADVVLFIYRDEYYNRQTERQGTADIIIAKHRNGPIGEVELGFEASQTRFYDREENIAHV